MEHWPPKLRFHGNFKMHGSKNTNLVSFLYLQYVQYLYHICLRRCGCWVMSKSTVAVGRELYGLFHVPDAAMPRDAAGQLMSPWNLVQSVLAEEVTTEFFFNETLCFSRFKVTYYEWLFCFFFGYSLYCDVKLCIEKDGYVYIFNRQHHEIFENKKRLQFTIFLTFT